MRPKALYNPFYTIAGFKSFLIGLAGLLATSYLAFITGMHFNGMLNIDFAKDSGLWVFLLENTIHWAILSTILYIAGLSFSKSKIRFIDVLGTLLLSRLPLIIAPLLRTIPVFQSFAFLSATMYFIILIYMLSAIWMITLSYHAYKISCNLKNEHLIISFIAGMILTEVLTKTALYLII
jgi:hypothetical protein